MRYLKKQNFEVHVNYTATVRIRIKSADKYQHTRPTPNIIKICCMLSKIKYSDKHRLPLVYNFICTLYKNAFVGIWALPWN